MRAINNEWPEFAKVESKFNLAADKESLIKLGRECGDGESFIPFLALLFTRELPVSVEEYIIEELATDWDPGCFAWNCMQAGRIIEKYL